MSTGSAYAHLEVYAVNEGIVEKNTLTGESIIYKYTTDQTLHEPDNSENSETEPNMNVNIDITKPEPYKEQEEPVEKTYGHLFYDRVKNIINMVHIKGSDIQCNEQRIIEMDIGNLLLDMMVKNKIINIDCKCKYLLYNFNLKQECFYFELMPNLDNYHAFDKAGQEFTFTLDVLAGENGEILPYYTKNRKEHYFEVLFSSMDLSGEYDMYGIPKVTKSPESCLDSIIFHEDHLKGVLLDEIEAQAKSFTSKVAQKQKDHDDSVAKLKDTIKEKLKIQEPDPVLKEFYEREKGKQSAE